MFLRLLYKVKRKLGIPLKYPSETSKVRHLVLDYCIGHGCDIGFGGDKIKKEAIGIDFAIPYALTGSDEVDIACNVIENEIPVKDETFDYVYSSHLIEDFENTTEGLAKFIRILKNNGLLILVFPDQQIYEQHCARTGQPLNMYHKHKNMGRDYMLQCLDNLNGYRYEIVFQSNCEIDYNVILVLKISKDGKN
jgi:ubiquinone/menaquinone biosynthesis C-methylase UbiE